MTIKQFRASRRWSDDIGAEISLDLGEVTPGFVYAGGLTIEAPAGGAGPDIYRLVIANMIYTGSLHSLENRLYVFGRREEII